MYLTYAFTLKKKELIKI